MSPSAPATFGRVRTAVGLALALSSLSLVVWLTCRPAGAEPPRGGVLHAAAPRSSVVVSVLRSEPRLTDPGTPIPEDAWSRSHARASTAFLPELAETLVARAIPPAAELQLDSGTPSMNAAIGSVAHLEDGSVRIIDGWTNGSSDLQVEFRLRPNPDGAPTIEVGAWDVRGNEAPSAWSDLRGDVATSHATWKDGDRVVLRYRVLGRDSNRAEREERGLVFVVVP
ncbi:MAG: hypothetical protein IPJ77_24675 [Planctomycetes bacterium]|nr:hypothetical protein [Planctomycetota bacterium]